MNKIFDSYARYYDLLYQNKDYETEVKYLAGLLHQYAPRANRVLELGCGTGAHAEHLARMGYKVHGVDLSPAMLKQAEQRKAALPNEIADRLTFELGDARNYRNNKKFDIVLSLFHVFSYQTSNIDLRSVFETAAEHLDEEGMLLFDYWYGPAVITQRPEVRIQRLEDDRIKVVRIAEPEVYLNENRVTVNYTVQIAEKQTDQRREVVEKHEMRYLFLPEIEQVGSSWFTVKDNLAWMEDRQPTSQDWCAMSILFKSI